MIAVNTAGWKKTTPAFDDRLDVRMTLLALGARNGKARRKESRPEIPSWPASTALLLGLAVLMTGCLATPPRPSPTADEKAAAEQGHPQGPFEAEPVGEPSVYTHPQKGYTVGVPAGAAVAERPDERGDIAIRSRRGYVISIQVGELNSGLTLKQMSARMEERYLGTGKPWGRKLSEREAHMGTKPALDALYEGSNSRTRVLIIRDDRDYVFMFFAPPDSFSKLEPEFEWVMTTFRPHASGSPKEAARKPGPAAEAVAPSAPPAAPPGAPPPAPALENRRFAEAAFGFAIDYPAEWVIERTPHMLVFSGAPGSDSYFATVSVQNVQPAVAQAPQQAADAALVDLKRGLDGEARDVQYFGEGNFTYSRDGVNLVGHKFLATYSHQGQRFRKWAMILPRPDRPVAHVWLYTAPENRFETYRPVAENMLKSWSLLLATPGTPPPPVAHP